MAFAISFKVKKKCRTLRCMHMITHTGLSFEGRGRGGMGAPLPTPGCPPLSNCSPLAFEFVMHKVGGNLGRGGQLATASALLQKRRYSAIDRRYESVLINSSLYSGVNWPAKGGAILYIFRAKLGGLFSISSTKNTYETYKKRRAIAP